MKKISIFLLLLTLLILFSCDNRAENGQLRLTLFSPESSSGARTILPYNQSLSIYSYAIEGNGPGGKIFSVTTLTPQILIDGLAYGTWEITATGFNEQGTELIKGTLTHQLTTKTTSAEIHLNTFVGSGFVDVDFTWLEDAFSEVTFKLYLSDQAGNEEQITQGITLDENNTLAHWEATLASGSYTLRYELFSNSIKIAGGTEAMRIIDAVATTGTIEVILNTASDAPHGIRVINKSALPIEGSISGINSSILPNTPVIATFHHLQGGGSADITVDWYLDGEHLGSGLETTFSTYTGFHRLDAVAQSSYVGSLGSTTLPFRATVANSDTVGAPIQIIEHGQYDENNQSYALANISSCLFLRDGRLLIASTNTLQLCEIVHDSLRVVATFNGGTASSNPSATSHYTYGVTEIAADVFDDLVFTISPSTNTLVLYQYDSKNKQLIQIDYRRSDTNTEEYWDSMSTLICDPINNFLYFVDNPGEWLAYYSYDDTALNNLGFTQLESAGVGILLEPIGSGAVTPAGELMALTSPGNNAVHVVSNSLFSYPPNPFSTMLYSFTPPEHEIGLLKGVKLTSSLIYAYGEKGLLVYQKHSGGYSWGKETTLTSGLQNMENLLINATHTKGWAICSSTESSIALLEFINETPLYKKSLSIGTFRPTTGALSCQEDLLALVGNDSNLMLIRVGDQ